MRSSAPHHHVFARRVSALALMALGLSACMKYDRPAQAAAACAVYAQNTCTTLSRCSVQLVTSLYGSVDQCEQALVDQCIPALVLPDVLGTPDGTRTCAARMTSVSCSDLFNRTLPPECQPPSGLRANGATCSSSAQCASAHCSALPTDSSAGTCSELSQASQPCEQSDDCASGLLCNGAVCKAPAPSGAACDASSPCRSPFACSAGICGPATTGADCGGVTSCAALSSATSPDVACMNFAQAVCGRLAACESKLVEAVYGDVQACSTQTIASCTRTLKARDTSATPSGIAVCAEAMKTLDCGALLDHASPDACQLATGPRADGAACTLDAQCASTRCKFVTTSTCGTCTALAQREEACLADSDCARTLVCTQDGVCRAPSIANATCDATHPCAYPLSCAAGRCVSALQQGAACTLTADACDRYAGLACDASSHCSPWPTARAGERCRDPVRGEFACTAGAICGDGPSALCQAPLLEGSACNLTTGPKCRAPARCLQGRCSVPSDEVCR